jgi:hypothetical protein
MNNMTEIVSVNYSIGCTQYLCQSCFTAMAVPNGVCISQIEQVMVKVERLEEEKAVSVASHYVRQLSLNQLSFLSSFHVYDFSTV